MFGVININESILTKYYVYDFYYGAVHIKNIVLDESKKIHSTPHFP